MSWSIGDKTDVFLNLKSKMAVYHYELTTPEISHTKMTLTVVQKHQLQDLE